MHRLLGELGIHNQVIAPSHIPRVGRKKVKSDRIDAIELATYLREAMLTAIYIPSDEDEFMREKTRLRHVCQKRLLAAKQQVMGFLRRHGLRYSEGKSNWTKTYWTWLGKIQFSHRGLQMVFLDYVQQVEALLIRLKELDLEIRNIKERWVKKDVVDAIAACKGLDTFSATSIVAEIREFSRFRTASEFMGYLGLAPSEYSSGKKVSRGSITKTGNARMRKMLVEAAKSYRRMPRKNNKLLERWARVPVPMRDHAWKAQRRLFKQYWKHLDAGKHPNIATVAVARELAGFIWALATQAEKSELAKELAS
ncbi:MAG: IS110 family transposase [Acidobacteria bacterium]|nr:IS110 family transposase [Acidobacteriota bacterium]